MLNKQTSGTHKVRHTRKAFLQLAFLAGSLPKAFDTSSSVARITNTQGRAARALCVCHAKSRQLRVEYHIPPNHPRCSQDLCGRYQTTDVQ